jgi:hypothetical protein
VDDSIVIIMEREINTFIGRSVATPFTIFLQTTVVCIGLACTEQPRVTGFPTIILCWSGVTVTIGRSERIKNVLG